MPQTGAGPWRDLKCASCHEILENPVQLKDCFHILCFECKQDLEKTSGHCPQCGNENGRGLRNLVLGLLKRSCDVSVGHESAQWNCFTCGKNLCNLCSESHPHSVSRLQDSGLENRIQSDDVAIQDPEQIDITRQDALQCPICTGVYCQHIQLLQDLISGHQTQATCCRIQGHVSYSKEPEEMKFFCKVCWTPICCVCSQGEHKAHATGDISTCWKEFMLNSFETCCERLHMLKRSSDQDSQEAETIEDQLGNHFHETEEELKIRKRRILADTGRAFDNAISTAATRGSIILTQYKEKLNRIKKFQVFVRKTEEALRRISTNPVLEDISSYVRAFTLERSAVKLIHELDKEYKKLEKPEEQQLVLPEVEAVLSPPPPLARVGIENKNLKLAFSFKLEDNYSRVESIVVTNTYECLLSVRKSREETDFDCLVLCSCKDEVTAKFKEYDVDKGRYFLSRLQSGEIVASFSDPSKNASKYSNSVLYFNGIFPSRSKLTFKSIYTFEFRPFGIAVTKDNNIILCVNADEKILPEKEKINEEKGLISVISMSLHGKVLKSTVSQPGANFLRPDYIAVGQNGDICISDKENSSIVILDENLEIRERMNYGLSASMINNKFCPHGACYDNYGRIIVADPDNNCLVRLVRGSRSLNKRTDTLKYKLEPLLSRTDEIPLFTKPNLVAMDHSRLWVCCSGHVFVFDYCE